MIFVEFEGQNRVKNKSEGKELENFPCKSHKRYSNKNLHPAANPIGSRLRPAGNGCNGSLRIRDMIAAKSMRLSFAIRM